MHQCVHFSSHVKTINVEWAIVLDGRVILWSITVADIAKCYDFLHGRLPRLTTNSLLREQCRSEMTLATSWCWESHACLFCVVSVVWFVFCRFLADRTTVVLLLYCCVCRLSVTLCIVAKRCVLEQKLLWRAYRKSYMRNQLVPKWMTLTFV